MEDVLEQIVGEIWDETDTVEHEVIRRADGEYELDGDMILLIFWSLWASMRKASRPTAIRWAAGLWSPSGRIPMWGTASDMKMWRSQSFPWTADEWRRSWQSFFRRAENKPRDENQARI